VVLPPSEATEQLAGALIGDGLNGAAKDVEKAGGPAAAALQADIASGTLIAGAPTAPVTAPRRPKSAADCTTGADGKRLSPLTPADMRASGSSSSC
jgi:hypothetical protein